MRTRRGKDYLEFVDVDKTTKLRYFLQKFGVEFWTEFVFIQIATCGGLW
jgi:hypothetical protein